VDLARSKKGPSPMSRLSCLYFFLSRAICYGFEPFLFALIPRVVGVGGCVFLHLASQSALRSNFAALSL
jgi:hypothetical protein